MKGRTSRKKLLTARGGRNELMGRWREQGRGRPLWQIAEFRLRMSKTLLLREIVSKLSESLGLLQRAARASHAEATHESSKAENKYDTRGLEAAYLARGQARHAKEIVDSIKVYESLALKEFAPGEAVDLTALVELEVDRLRSFFFVGPTNGGLELQFDGREVTVVTPQSPLGQHLIGKKARHRWTAKIGSGTVRYHLVAVT